MNFWCDDKFDIISNVELNAENNENARTIGVDGKNNNDIVLYRTYHTSFLGRIQRPERPSRIYA